MKKNKIWNKLRIFSLKVSLKLSVQLKPESQKNLSLYGGTKKRLWQLIHSLNQRLVQLVNDQKSRTGDQYSVLI